MGGTERDSVTLEGPRIRLEPLARRHYAALVAIGLDPGLWARTTIRIRTPEEMTTYLEEAEAARAAGTSEPFAIVLRESGTVIGTTRFHSIVPRHRRLEIGFTWVGIPWQRGGISTESKVLLLTHAFEDRGCERVEFKADSQNEASCAALERLGATREGILRRYMHSEHAGMRDVALFSIVAPDWPRLKARLERRLAGCP